MKNLKNLGKTLNKNEQKEINGGMLFPSPINQVSCATVCLTASRGYRCVRPHCIYVCDGNGGFYAL